MLSRVFRRFSRTRAQNGPAPRAGRLGFERLEPREVPATVYGLTTNNTLLRFDSAAPGVLQGAVAITNLAANQTVVGIDFRPRTGQLFAAAVTTGSTANSPLAIYRINPLTGVAVQEGFGPTLAGAADVGGGFEYSPVNELISGAFSPLPIARYVNASDENARLAFNVLVADDANLTPAGAQVVAAAYDRNYDRPDTTSLPVTLYGISRATSSLVTIGGVDGAPSADTGSVASVGALGVTLDAATDAGFDIAVSTDNGSLGTALAALTVGGVTGLYSINLATGAAALVGPIGNGSTQLRGLAVVPDGVVVVGSGPGASGDVRVLDPATGAVRLGLVPFPGFQGGVKVAAGDVTGDGIPDVVVGADAPQGHIKVFDGATGAERFSFFAFENFLGTVNVACGDTDGDGYADVVVVANGAGGHVKAFSGKNGALLTSFLAYPGFPGVVTVAAVDISDGVFDEGIDGVDEIVTAASLNGHVRAFHLNGSPFIAGALRAAREVSFFAFEGFQGIVNVTGGSANTADGSPNLVVSTGAGTRGHVKAFSAYGVQNASFFALPVGATGGAAAALADADRDGRLEIRVTPGPGTQADVLAFDGFGNLLGVTFPAFADYQGGASIAGARF